MKLMANKREWFWVLALIIFIGFNMVVMAFVVFLSLQKSMAWPWQLQGKWSFEAWYYLIHTADFKDSVSQSLMVATATAFVVLILGVPCGMGLAKCQEKSQLAIKRIMEVLVFSPIVVPPTTLYFGMYLLFLRIGLTDTLIGVALAHAVSALPYMVWSVRLGYESLASGYDEQARMLGMTRSRRFAYVTLPMLMPSISAGLAITFLISFSQYLPTLLIGGGSIKSLTLVMYPYLASGEIRLASAYTVVFSVIALLVLYLLDRVLRKVYNQGTGG